MSKKSAKPETITIKKYANRRLYNTETSTYITLEDLCRMVRDGKDFTVVDANSGADLTSQILTQIIFEQETKGNSLLPQHFLRSVIGFYDNNMSSVLQHYLDASIQTFVQNQDKMRGLMGKAMQGFSPMNQLEEMTRSNITLFEKAMQMFTPFGSYFAQQEERAEAKPAPKKASRNG